MAGGNYRRNYRRKGGYKGKKRPYNKTKKLVTGQEPTMVEKIASGVGEVAKLAGAVLPAIMAINTEHKYYDQTALVTAYNPGTNDQSIFLTQGIAQGTSDSDRIGNSILAKDIQLRMAINFPATATVQGIHCRAMLLCWKENLQANGPTIAKIFESPTNLYSPVNKDNSDQFVVIKDKFFTLECPNGLAVTAGFKTFKWFKKLDWHIRFIGSTTTSGSQNHLLLILRSSATGATNALGVTYYSRLNYTDN